MLYLAIALSGFLWFMTKDHFSTQTSVAVSSVPLATVFIIPPIFWFIAVIPFSLSISAKMLKSS